MEIIETTNEVSGQFHSIVDCEKCDWHLHTPQHPQANINCLIEEIVNKYLIWMVIGVTLTYCLSTHKTIG